MTSAALFALCAWTALHGQIAVSMANVLLWAIVFRIPFILSPPVLSDDVWRYLWDGKVAVAGINPYSYAPDDPALFSLRDGLWDRVNHRSVPTIYPPFAQILFRLAASNGGLGAWKVLVLGFDLASIGALVTGLERRERAPAHVLLYAWNPLVLVEFAWSAHVDVAAVALATWAIVVAAKRREAASLVLVSIATGIKLFPALLLPALLRRATTRRSWAIPVAIAIIGSVPYVSSGMPAWFRGLRIYARDWEFNGLPYLLCRAVVHDPMWARLILFVTLTATTVVVTARRSKPADCAVGVLAACVAMSPTVHPWYVTWPLPAAVLSDRPPRVACLLATLVVLVAYVVLVVREATGIWRLPQAWLLLEWSVVIVAFMVEHFSHVRRSAARR